MPQVPERRWLKIMVGYILFLAFLGGVAGYIYESASVASRPHVIRLAMVLLVAVILIHVRNHYRGDPRWEFPTDFETALAPDRAAPILDPEFQKLRADLENSARSWRYFEDILWPRFRALATARRADSEQFATPPRARRWLTRRGPSLSTLAILIDRIERRP